MTDNLLPFEKKEREIIIKKKAKTDEKFGCDPDKRPIKQLLDLGIININKPKGPTSHQVSSYVQGILKIKKSGHSGTLDPQVTGVLPVALGRGTRIVQTLLPAGKEYICLMHLHKTVDKEKLGQTIKQNFIGKIKQMPPIKSSVKRQWRFRNIYYIKILEIDGPDILFRIGCEAGTYIRKLCHDLGQKLGTGAHMAQLVRTKAGPFKEKEMITLQDLHDALWFYENEQNEKFLRHCIKPIEFAVQHLPKVWILDTTVESLCHGVNLKIPGIVKLHSGIEKDQKIAVMTLKDELVALGTAKMSTKEMQEKDKGIVCTTDKVFMEEKTYPKITQTRRV